MESRKKYFAISEVAEMFNLEQHVLRFWEGEFPQLHPQKNSAGKRAYTVHDISVIEKIKYLLQVERFTIEGARDRMALIKDVTLERYKQTSALVYDSSFWTELEAISQMM